MQKLAGIITEGEYKKKMEEVMDIGKPELLKRIQNLRDFGFTADKIDFKDLEINVSTQEEDGKPYYYVYGEGEDEDEGIFSSSNPREIIDFVYNYYK